MNAPVKEPDLQLIREYYSDSIKLTEIQEKYGSVIPSTCQTIWELLDYIEKLKTEDERLVNAVCDRALYCPDCGEIITIAEIKENVCLNCHRT